MADERVVPGRTEIGNVCKHIARYNLALYHVRGRVLDIACGSGYGTRLLADVVDSVLGIDFDPETVSYAQKNYSPLLQETPKLEFRVGDILEPIGEKFDSIVCFETLEHVEDINKALEN